MPTRSAFHILQRCLVSLWALIATGPTSAHACDAYTFSSTPGTFSDGSGLDSYEHNLDCQWALQCGDTGQVVQI
eukprot:COSAG02_NODE_63022_length_264_cov_0.630303_1_plen_73_part_01